MRKSIRWFVGAASLTMIAATLGSTSVASASGPMQRYIVRVRAGANYASVRSAVAHQGASVVMDLKQVGAFVVKARSGLSPALAATAGVQGLALDHIETVAPPEGARTSDGKPAVQTIRRLLPGAAGGGTFVPDPIVRRYRSLVWDYGRIQAPRQWDNSTGSGITVAVADTGLDYTHTELASQVSLVVDLAKADGLCTLLFGQSDQDLANLYGGPEDTDWYGHGSWIGGNIAAALNGQGVNGIAPGVSLVSLKIAQWCGYAYDSTIISAFLYAADHAIPVVSISFGGYLDRSDPGQDLIWNVYADTVAYAKFYGTAIVAAAGNEHAEIGTDGLVLTHGILTAPGGTLSDFFGWYEVPGGLPGVVDVSSTGNVVNASSASCADGTSDNTNATCKFTSDAHQAPGTGQRDQLAYYSNYGTRIDFAAPGGARKFNLPVWDRGGTGGFPVTGDDGTRAWEDFNITSDWATQIACYIFQQMPNDCFSTIQGTSMATPHVSAVLALVLAVHPEFIGDVDGLVSFVKSYAKPGHNTTQPLSATDTSPGDLSNIYTDDCTTGYCHLGGAAIPDDEAYGAGLLRVPPLG
jgi:subtilisin family serine protease